MAMQKPASESFVAQKRPERMLDRTVVWLSVLLGLVLLNIIGVALFGRLDLTRDREFTLSPASKKALGRLKEPVTIRAYFSRDLPPPHGSQARYVQDLLESYYTHARGRLRFEFVDPAEASNVDETDRKNRLKHDVFGNAVREPTKLERELEAMGIPAVQVRVNQADKVEVKRAYMGISVSYKGRREVLPVVTNTDGLEYDLTSLLRKVVQESPQKLAIATGHGGTDADREMGQALSALKEHYEIGKVDLKEANTLLPDADALLVIGPQTELTADEQRTLDAYVHAGHSVGLFLPPIKASLQGLTFEANHHGLDDLLGRYGVKIEPGLVLDARCATINVQQQQGFMRINQPVRYPFIAQAELLEPHAVTKGLGGVLLPFMGGLQITAPSDGPVTAQVWAKTSEQSWLQPEPFNLDPMQKWTPERASLARHDVLVALSGPMGRVVPKAGEVLPSEPPPPSPARVVVAASDSLWLDPFFGKSNQALLLNVVDWLVGDDDLLAVRSRGMRAAPLADIGEARRRTVKYGNIVGLPGLVVLAGLTRWRRRRERSRNVFL
jgi:gliding-associated putative ABC transporter substrate-binding component GldG